MTIRKDGKSSSNRHGRSGLGAEPSGYSPTMRTLRRKHLATISDRTETRVVVETSDKERIDIDGCSAAEVDAKLHDFYAWAS